MGAAYVVAWLRALCFTWLIEVGCGVFMLGRRASVPRRLGLLLLGSGVTHPFVWFVFPFIGLDFIPAMILAELFAVCVEAGIYFFGVRGLGIHRALAISLILNGLSLGLGLVLRHFWGLV